MGAGSAIGSLAGSLGGLFFANPSLGAAAGSAAGALIEGIPSLIETAAEQENKRRLKQLQLQEKLGQLGLTEAEKQSLFSAGQEQISGQLNAARGGIRAAGAAGMGGAGTASLQQAALAENQASLVGALGRGVEGKNLERKRELEDEIQARIAAKAQEQMEVASAVTRPASAGIQAYQEAEALRKEMEGGYGRGAKGGGGTGVGKGADGISDLTLQQKEAIKKARGLLSDEELKAFLKFYDENIVPSKYDGIAGATDAAGATGAAGGVGGN
jgi:hypothetical protein